MVKRPGERASDRFVSIGLSVLVHAVIVGALFWGWWQYRHTVKPAPQTLAIQGTVVTHAPPHQRAPTVTHAVPTPAPPPPPTAAQLAQQQAQREAAKLAVETQAAQKLVAQKAAAAAALETQRAAARSAALKEAQAEQAEAKAAQEQAARAAAAKAKAEAERVEEARRKAADEAARQAKLAAELKAKQEEAQREQQRIAAQLKAEQAEQQRESDLRSQMQAEEHLDALEHGPAEAEYIELITARISRAWIRPPSAQPGLKCIVHLTQIPGGEITNVTVEGCNGDEAVRQSVQTAAYRASPLPAPPDPALFDPHITVTFAPDQ